MHPSPRCFLAREWRLLVWLGFFGCQFGCFLGCRGPVVPDAYAPIPETWKQASLQRFTPPDWIQDLRRWAPDDSDLALLTLLDENSQGSHCSNWDSAAQKHRTSVLHFGASRRCAQEGDTAKALRHAYSSQKLDSGNAVTDLWLARLLAKTNRFYEARMIFFESRRFRSASLYGLEIENATLRVLQKAGRANPLSLVEAMGHFSEWKFAPMEEDLDVLYEVFLEPLETHPYDIRRRAPEAALRMVWAGEQLRRHSLLGPRILWWGMEERILGYAMEAKGWEFLLAHAHAFERADLITLAEWELRKVQREAESILPHFETSLRHSPSMEFLDRWQTWSADSDCTVEQALERASHQKAWLQAQREWQRFRPSSD
jgi:hypothetical protein